MRFTINHKGDVIGEFSHVQKKFVVPKFGTSGVGRNSFESEDGDRVQDSGANGNPSGREFP